MYFQGIFISIVCFSAVVLCQPLLIRAEFYFASRIWPVFFALGIILLLIALFTCYLWLSALFCSAALTFLYGALKLKQRTPCKGKRR